MVEANCNISRARVRPYACPFWLDATDWKAGSGVSEWPSKSSVKIW